MILYLLIFVWLFIVIIIIIIITIIIIIIIIIIIVKKHPNQATLSTGMKTVLVMCALYFVNVYLLLKFLWKTVNHHWFNNTTWQCVELA